MGVTPPHIYEFKPREALFHGVPALRLTPVGGEDKIFGRTGLLAHTYMLGPNGDFQRLRFLQGLLRVPQCLPEQGHQRRPLCWRGWSDVGPSGDLTQPCRTSGWHQRSDRAPATSACDGLAPTISEPNSI